MCSDIAFASVVPADQVEQREEEYPDNIDEVPVQPDVLHGTVPLRSELSAPRPDHEIRHQPEADDHMQRVHSSHREIEREEYLRLALVNGAEMMRPGNLFRIEVERRSRHVMLFE